MRKLMGTLLLIFLLVVATAGCAAYVLQEAFDEPMTFKEFFEMIGNKVYLDLLIFM